VQGGGLSGASVGGGKVQEEKEPTEADYRQESLILRTAIRELRDRVKELEEQVYRMDMDGKIARLKALPEPDLRMASEWTKTDFLAGRS